MRGVSARVAASGAVLLLCGSTAGAALTLRALPEAPSAGPTSAGGNATALWPIGATDPAAATDAAAAGDSAAAPPMLAGAGASATLAGAETPATLAGAAWPRYATEKPVVAAGQAAHSLPPVPLTTNEIGDPNAVIIRPPARDYGSGYHGDYGRYHRETSPDAQLRAAAAAANGCLIIGDSIATYVVTDLVADLRRTRGETCVYDTWPGRATEGTANALLDIKRRIGLPPRVIVMSGTNDIFNPPLFETQMNRLVDGVGADHHLIWVSTFDSRRPASPQSAADERNTAWINTVLQARAARTPSMRIVAWDALFRANSANVDALLPDGVHPNAAGVEAMVGLVRASLS